jgi:hypothetical protein
LHYPVPLLVEHKMIQQIFKLPRLWRHQCDQ